MVLRVVQGFAVGGRARRRERHDRGACPGRPARLLTRVRLQGTQAGAILATAALLPLAAFLSAEAFQTWGWRIPFLLSAVVVVAGYLIRRRIDETPRS